MTTSPWDGRSRVPLRAGLALISALDACLMGAHVMTGRVHGLSITGAGAWMFLQFAGRPVVVVPLVLVILAGLVLFVRRRSLLSGAIALVGVAILSTSLTVLQGHASRNFYTCGAVLFGWLCGEAVARFIFRESSAAHLDAWAEAGAAGAFAATYFAAGVSKMMARGLAWADASSLQSLALSQHSIVHTSWLGAYVNAIAHSRALAMTFTISTLIVELGAFVYVISSTIRMLWGALFIAFHVNVFLLTGIPYLENVLLAGLLSFPWPLLRPRTLRAAQAQPSAPAAKWRGVVAPAGLFLALALGIGLLPGRLRPVGDPYARAARANLLSAHASVGSRACSTLGPLRVGSALVGGWSIRRIEARARAARVALGRGDQRVVLVLSLDKPSQSAGPFSTGGVDISYRSTPLRPVEFHAAARMLVSQLVKAAGKPGLHEAMARWLRQCSPAGSAR